MLEIDERSSKRIYPFMKPDILALTNLFRDSIMRNAHPQYIADFLTDSIPPETKLVVNADDLIAASVAPDNPRVYFGIERMGTCNTSTCAMTTSARPTAPAAASGPRITTTRAGTWTWST